MSLLLLLLSLFLPSPAAARITSRCYEYTNPALNRCYTAEYDAVGNPTRMTDPEGADVAVYDAASRLLSVTRQTSGQPDALEAYAYNALGAVKTNAGVVLDDQRAKLAGGGTADAAVPATLGGQAVTLNGAGRVTHLRDTTLTFNGRARLSAMERPAGGAVEKEIYGYDAAQRRIARVRTLEGGGSSTVTAEEYYAYEGANVAGMLSSSNAVEASWVYDGVDHPLRMKLPGSPALTYFYELDLAGNVRRLRRPDGSDAGGYRYTAFGQSYPVDAGTPAPAVSQPMRWKGRWYSDFAGGIYDVRARVWSPELGTFLSIDEYAFHDRKSTLWGWPGQSPTRWRDPSGHDRAPEGSMMVGLFSPAQIDGLFDGGTQQALAASDAWDSGNYLSAFGHLNRSVLLNDAGLVASLLGRRKATGADMAMMACPIEMPGAAVGPRATFIGQEVGPAIVIPEGATGPTLARSGKGVIYSGGSGGDGLTTGGS